MRRYHVKKNDKEIENRIINDRKIDNKKLEKLKLEQLNLKIPPLLKIMFLLIGLGCAVGLVESLFLDNSQFLVIFADLALILTLVVIILYVYYTYLIAKLTWFPSAALSLNQSENDPYLIIPFLYNYSKLSLKCKCNLNASVCGQPVSLEGFYSGESSFDLQPLFRGRGNFDIKELVAKAGLTVERLEKKANDKNFKQQLYLNVDFWYGPVGSEVIIQNVKQPYYFDFRTKKLVLDF